MAPPSTRRWPLYALGIVCTAIAAVAISSAVAWYGHPIADVSVDPGGLVSNVGLPSASGKSTGLKFPDLVLEVDGQRLIAGPGVPRARVWDTAIERAYLEGRSSVRATVLTRDGVRVV